MDSEATLAAWRAQGADALDPVRFRFLEAMARRTAAHEGLARQRLDEKLGRALAAYAEALERPRKAPAPAMTAPDAAPHCSPLAELVAQLAQHAPHATPQHGGPAAAPELKSLQLFRSTWARLSADRWLTQSRAAVPDNAGPLNSQQLVHRALQLMQDTSPGYLNRLIPYVEALLWLEQAQGPAARTDGERKPARGKAG